MNVVFFFIIRRFYIGCERCGDWFHGRCVGILQKESESIDEYLCPNCEPNSPINQANMHTISSQHYDHIGKLLRQVMVLQILRAKALLSNTSFEIKTVFLTLQSNRNSGPFREPVRPRSVPNYYKIVKEPMGKKMGINLDIANQVQKTTFLFPFQTFTPSKRGSTISIMSGCASSLAISCAFSKTVDISTNPTRRS